MPPTHSTLHPDVQGSFEVTLARGLNMARKRLPIQTAISKHKRRFLSLADHQRQELAAAFHWEYRRRSARLCDDEGALQLLNEQYSNAQCFVTPIHRLPAEVLMDIFRIVFDINSSLIRVMLVCNRWFHLAGHMTRPVLPLSVSLVALQGEYRRLSARFCDHKGAMRVLNEQYNNAQRLATPIHRLPAEIIMEIFRIVFDINQPSTKVTLVCCRWYRVIGAMTGLQLPLELGTWTDPGMVQRAVGGMARRLLNIMVDTDQDFEFGGSSGEPYSALAIAAGNASLWRSLTVHSLPRGGQLSDQSLHTLITSMDISPMSRLEEVKLTLELDPSPLVDHLLQNIGATAMRSLMKMETSSLYAIRLLLQTPSTYTFCSLTTFRAMVRKMNETIDLLSHFSKLEVLEVTNLLLPSYQDETPLPFVQTLRYLYLKTVSIDWMAGRVFPVLDACTIITPPRPFLAFDVHLSTCRDFQFHHLCTTSLGRFRMPMVSLLAIDGNQWNPLKGSESLVHICMAGLGTVLRPSVLHLTILCNESVLISALRLLPNLRELSLKLPRPSALGRCFFTALLAQPATMPLITSPAGYSVSSGWFYWAEQRNRWYTALCPSLRVFELWYRRWLRPSEQIGMVAPLLALGWTRQKTATPLQNLCVHMKANSGDWNSVELLPVKPECLMDLNIPHLQSLELNNEEHRALFEMNLTSAALSVIDEPICRFRYITEALFGPSFHRLRALSVRGRQKTKTPLNVLHCFHHLEDLALYDVQVSHCDHNVDLPLFQTLKRLTLWKGCVKWLDGHKFFQLTSFQAWAGPEWNNSFPQRVDMPVCTYIRFYDHGLESLPVFRAGIVVPRLYEWDMPDLILNRQYFMSSKKHAGIEALEQIREQVLRVAIYEYYQGLITIITPKCELEELSILIEGSYSAANGLLYALRETTDAPLSTEAPDGHVNTTGICNGTVTKVICPNLKALSLRFGYSSGPNREKVRQWCEQMMEGRKQAGNPLGRCSIRWDNKGHKDSLLVLITSNEGVIENE